MPIFKAGPKLVYYAHVPKCGGSAVGWYLEERFGQIAFADRRHTSQPQEARWSRTSPQHIDHASLSRLFPDGFFDALFTIVRHPVARTVSAFHFQLEVEKLIPAETTFSDWLADLEERLEENPFVFDNHVRPMSDIVPEGAHVFYMEHGLDSLVGWFDALVGSEEGPRALPKINEQGAYSGTKTEKARPSEADLERISRIYAADFKRFGYEVGTKAPATPAPVLSAQSIADRDAYLKSFNAPLNKIRRKLGGKFGS